MAGNQAPSVNDTDTIFLEAVHNAATGAHYLDVYGPRIDVWPSGYKTLGFGGETDSAPAAAAALAAAGGIAVRATAGESDAASVYAAHQPHIGLTLKSTTAHSALRSLSHGGGLVATLAIAANIADTRSEPHLTATLLDAGPTETIFGESVGDVERRTGRDGGSSVNALHYIDKGDLLTDADKALRKYLSRYYRTSIPEEQIPLYAYAALVRRTNALEQPGSPMAKIWLGAVVEAGDAVSDRLPAHTSLQKVLHPACFEIYNGAIDRGITERPSGLYIADTGGKSVPQRQRSTAEAARLGVAKGVSASEKGVARRAQEQASVASSYTGRRAAAEQGSNNRQYLEILQTGLQRYLDCREQVRQTMARRAASRAHVWHALAGSTEKGERLIGPDGRPIPHVFGDYPFLQSFFLERVAAAERDLPVLIEEGNALQVASGTIDLARHRSSNNMSRAQNRIDLGNGIAAASILRSDSPEARTVYEQLVSDPVIKAVGAMHLEETLELVLLRSVEDLPPEELARYRLKPGQASREFRLQRLDHPPVQLLVMAADIVNTNAHSVLPLGRPVRLRGRSYAERQAAKSIYENLRRTTWRDRRRLAKEKEAAAYAQAEMRVTNIHETLRAFLEHRYRIPIDDERGDTRMLGFLTECAIAEELDFDNAPRAVQNRIAHRIYRAAHRGSNYYDQRRSIRREELPPKLQRLYDHAQATVERQSEGRRGTNLRSWLDKVFPMEDYRQD